MAKQDWTMYIYKTDRRTKSGERIVSTTVWTDRTRETMENEVRGLRAQLYPTLAGFRIEFLPKMVTVKNLMTGADVEIDRDTPWCCNPASETYWSM